jgi:hypothetical protein
MHSDFLRRYLHVAFFTARSDSIALAMESRARRNSTLQFARDTRKAQSV